MYKAIIIIFLSLWSITLNAQLEVNRLYKVYLKDSRVFRGELINDTTDFIELKLLDGTIVQVQKEDITVASKFSAPFPKIANYHLFDDLPNGTKYRLSGSYIIFQLGIIRDRSSNASTNDPDLQPTFTLINGYQFSNGSAVGLGINFDIYNKAFFPVFVDFRRYFTRRPISFYGSTNVGYAFAIDQFTGIPYSQQEGGLMHQIGGGIDIATDRNINFIFELSYRTQHYKKREDFQYDLIGDRFKHWFLQLGITF